MDRATKTEIRGILGIGIGISVPAHTDTEYRAHIALPSVS